ncbi:MAG: YggS family pyridoxal phosphate enzyme [Thermoleophilia bacterium]|nr:YggS family pyridoxal phosphate enzyme [Thermoleophilia bacterium]
MVAATKYVDADGCRSLIEAGITDLAESRLDSLVAKQDAGVGATGVSWHFIGRLQSRQARDAATRASMVHTLCTASAAARLADLDPAELPELLVQVNVAGDPAKDGLAPDDVERFLLSLPPALEVRGFMAMPAFAEDSEGSRPAFAGLRELRDTLAPLVAGRHRLEHLSIGTSQDWEVAVEEGATHVRLGRILYAHGE